MATHEAGPQRRRFVEDVVAMNSMRPSEELRQKYGFRYDGETFRLAIRWRKRVRVSSGSAELTSSSNLSLPLVLTDQGYLLVRKATQQVPHGLPPLWEDLVPHPEEDVLELRIPRQEDEELQLGTEGQGTQDRRHRTYAVHEDADEAI